MEEMPMRTTLAMLAAATKPSSSCRRVQRSSVQAARQPSCRMALTAARVLAVPAGRRVARSARL